MDLTFAEQVKIVLSRKNMTIKQLAEEIQEKTGQKMSRQNLTQRLGRDNFQEQDMRMIAEILGCPFQLNILDAVEEEDGDRLAEIRKKAEAKAHKKEEKAHKKAMEDPKEEPEEIVGNDVTVGDMIDMIESVEAAEPEAAEQEEVVSAEQEKPAAAEREKAAPVEQEKPVAAEQEKPAAAEQKKEKKFPKWEPKPAEKKEDRSSIWNRREEKLRKKKESHPHGDWIGATPQSRSKDFMKDAAETGEINPYTGREYETNSVRMHPKRIGYIQVYDRGNHKWTDMTEWAFYGFQEQKKSLLGPDYDEPIYLD